MFVFLFMIIISSVVVILVYDVEVNEEEVENVSEKINDDKVIEFEQGGESVVVVSFVEQTLEYNTSQKVMDLINSFEVIERDGNLLPAKTVYEAGEGTEYDLLRLALNILLNHNIQGSLIVYEYGENIGAVVNFRDVEQPMYYYFEEGIMKMSHHGWSFDELISTEENRLGIEVNRYGALFEGDMRGDKNLNIIDVEMWKER